MDVVSFTLWYHLPSINSLWYPLGEGYVWSEHSGQEIMRVL